MYWLTLPDEKTLPPAVIVILPSTADGVIVWLIVVSDAVKLKGDVTTTALGDLLVGKASDGGYKRLAVSTGGANQLLQINSSGNDLEFTDTLDGGTF